MTSALNVASCLIHLLLITVRGESGMTLGSDEMTASEGMACDVDDGDTNGAGSFLVLVTLDGAGSFSVTRNDIESLDSTSSSGGCTPLMHFICTLKPYWLAKVLLQDGHGNFPTSAKSWT